MTKSRLAVVYPKDLGEVVEGQVFAHKNPMEIYQTYLSQLESFEVNEEQLKSAIEDAFLIFRHQVVDIDILLEAETVAEVGQSYQDNSFEIWKIIEKDGDNLRMVNSVGAETVIKEDELKQPGWKVYTDIKAFKLAPEKIKAFRNKFYRRHHKYETIKKMAKKIQEIMVYRDDAAYENRDDFVFRIPVDTVQKSLMSKFMKEIGFKDEQIEEFWNSEVSGGEGTMTTTSSFRSAADMDDIRKKLMTPEDLSKMPVEDQANVLTLHFIGYVVKPTGISDELYHKCLEAFNNNRGKFEEEEAVVLEVLKESEVKQADSGSGDGSAITPSTKKTDFRTDYNVRSQFRTNWRKDMKKKSFKAVVGEKSEIFEPTKVPYPRDKNDPNYEKMKEEYDKTDYDNYNNFKAYLAKKYGVEGNPKFEKCFGIAWSEGHSAGYNEVESFFAAIVDLIK